jgi:hypothetical protein
MSTSHVRTSASKSYNDDGVAITTEYVLLLGVSLFIFSAIYIGFNSFYNTSASDSRAQSAGMIATYVSDHISDLSSGDATAEEKIGMPGLINGDAYVVYPSRDGHDICVMTAHDHSKVYMAPIVCKSTVMVKGFIVSQPDEHRIAYDPDTNTVTLS